MQFFIVYFYPLPTVSKVSKYSWKKYILWVLSSVCVWEKLYFQFSSFCIKNSLLFFFLPFEQFHSFTTGGR